MLVASDEEIARLVRTTIPNVWKEKSNLRKSGVLVRQRVERRDRTLLVTSASQGLYSSQRKAASLEYQELLNIPPIDSEGMKKLYTNIIAGKKPNEIIAEHGFHPAVVEAEYHRLYTNIVAGKKPNEIIAEHGFHPAVVEASHRQEELKIKSTNAAFNLV
jgi:hypothetical protein